MHDGGVPRVVPNTMIKKRRSPWTTTALRRDADLFMFENAAVMPLDYDDRTRLRYKVMSTRVI